jgi:hypothetical protein
MNEKFAIWRQLKTALDRWENEGGSLSPERAETFGNDPAETKGQTGRARNKINGN